MRPLCFICDSFASQLSEVKKYRNGSLAQTVEYLYDADGNRRKVVDSSGTRYVLYDGGAPLMELDENKNITAYYVYGAAGVIYKRDISSDSYEFHHKNALGSVIMLAGVTDAGTNIIARYEYDAFGSIRTQAGSSDNTHKFTGKEYDDDVKLYYYGARYYDAYIGRFISRDPAGDGINWYVYCRNNPLGYVDPDGLATYNRYEAVRYAKRYWKKYNKKYALRKGLARIFGGTPPDCTNFISQCLHAGGFKMTEDWYFYPGRYDRWGRHTKQSRTWTVASEFGEWLRGSGWVAKETSYTLKKEDISTIYGDLIAFVSTRGRIYHWTIITKITGKFSPKGKVYITYHTTL